MPFCSSRRRRSYRSLLLWTVVLATGLAGGRAVHAAGSGTSQQDAGLSCKTILNAGLSTGDGLYWIDPNGGDHADAFQAYCDMTTDGGGWTLAVNSVTGEEPTTTDMTSNTGVVAENRAHTRDLTNLAINNDAEIRYFIDNTNNGRVFHAKYTGRYHNPLPAAFGSWTTLPGHVANSQTLIEYHFGRPWSTPIADRDEFGGACTSTYTVPWYYGACWTAIPTNAQNGYTQGPVASGGTIPLLRFAIFVREVSSIVIPPTHIAPSFRPALNRSVGGGPNDVVTWDFDRDGKADVLTANALNGVSSITVHYGNGTVLHQAAPPGPHLITLGNFDGNLLQDFALANANGQITVYLNQGTNFSPTSFSGCVASGIGAADFDQNGTFDLALGCSGASPLLIASGSGFGTFTIVNSLGTGTSNTSLAVADFNGDGRRDIVVTGGPTGCFNVFQATGGFTFASNLQCGGTFMGPVTVGDFDVDDKPDLVVGGTTVVNSLRNIDGVHFTSVGTLSVGSVNDVALHSLNFDGRIDLLLSQGTSTMQVHMGQGGGAFGPPVQFNTSSAGRAVAAADIDGDGRIDAVTADNLTDSISVFLNSFVANLPPSASNGTLTVIEGTSENGALAGTDPEGAALTFALTSTGTKGTATLLDASTGAYAFAANPGESGIDTFTFTASDGVTTSAPGTITVTIAPKHTPQITWLTPAPIGYGTVLGTEQLNATADVDGTFLYSPAAGTPLGAGPTQTLSVTFTPTDSAHYSSTSASVLLDVLQAPLTVRTVNASIVFGQPVPSFTVTYDGFVYGETPAALGGTLAFTGPASTDAGSYPITPGGLTSPNYAFAFQPGTLIIAQAPTTTALSASPPTAGLLQPVKLTATVGSSAAGAGIPTGTVRFHVDGAPIGTASLSGGVATLTVNGMTPGAHAVTATYDGTLNFGTSTSAATSVTVRPASQSTFTLAFAPTAPTALGQRASLAALVVNLGGGPAPAGTVVFVDGSTVIGTAALSGGVATISTTSLAAGPHFIFAVYAGNASFASSVSSPAVHNVFTGTIPPTLTLALTASPTPSTLGSPVTVSVVLPPASGTPTGTVVFLSDNVVIGTAPVTNLGGLFRADLTTSGLATGVHLLSAIYLGDGVFGASGAGPVVLAVQ